MNGGPFRVGVLNALPGVLAHFENALVDNMSSPGRVELTRLETPGIEVGSGAGQRQRFQAAARFLWAARRQAKRQELDIIISAWPSFGYLDALVWRLLRVDCPVVTILHDVTPLRSQFGYWPQAVRPLRLGPSKRHRWIVHTEDAQMEAIGLDLGAPQIAPHPLLPKAVNAPEGKDVLVFGQYKPARDLELLAKLGPELQSRGLNPKIVGRGWPEIEGWSIEDRFVEEADVPRLLASARVVLIPYRRYYQSGVALRSMEAGTPVAGIRTSFLSEFFGTDWPGLLDPDGGVGEWLSAIEAASELSSEEIAFLAESKRQSVSGSWSKLLTEMARVK